MQIDKMDAREKLAAYDDAYITRAKAKQAEKDSVAQALYVEREALLEKQAQDRDALRRQHYAAIDALDEKIKAATAEIETRYDAMPEIETPDIGDDAPLEWNYDDIPMPRCAKSGVVLLKGDELVEDAETDEQYLRAALGLPARDQDKAGSTAPDAQWASEGANAS